MVAMVANTNAVDTHNSTATGASTITGKKPFATIANTVVASMHHTDPVHLVSRALRLTLTILQVELVLALSLALKLKALGLCKT